MPIMAPARPMKGAKIPSNWFGDFYDYVKSLEVRGDLNTTVVHRDRSGTVVHANLSRVQQSDSVRATSFVAKIVGDEYDGTYHADEQVCDAGTFEDDGEPINWGDNSEDIGFLYELNGYIGVPINTFVIVHRVPDISGDPIWYFDSGMDAGGRSFWAKITGETTGSYSWTELQGDATTATSRTGTTNAEEVSGRLGIPTNSIVRMWSNSADYDEFKFEYHGANDGTLDTIDGGVGTSANSDEWERADQGVTRGEIHPYVARLTLDSSTGELAAYSRTQTHDANGHETNISSETKTLLGVSTPSDETYEFVDCATGATTVSRFAFADLPAHDYAFVHDGADFVKAYNDGLSAGAASSPVPCVVMMPTAPANCAAVTFAAFDDSFDDSSIDECRWTTSTPGSGTLVETTSLAFDAPVSGANSSAILISSAPLGGDDFSFEIDFASLSLSNDGVAAAQFLIQAVINGVTIQVGYTNGGGGSVGESVFDGTSATYYSSSIPSSGTIEVSRTGTSLACKIGGSTLQTVSISGSLTALSVVAFSNDDGDASATVSQANYTGG